jgi:hypothetical protein
MHRSHQQGELLDAPAREIPAFRAGKALQVRGESNQINRVGNLFREQVPFVGETIPPNVKYS